MEDIIITFVISVQTQLLFGIAFILFLIPATPMFMNYLFKRNTK